MTEKIITIDGILFKYHPHGHFAASRCGKIIGPHKKVLKPKSQGFYRIVSYYVVIGDQPKVRHKYVHRLVAETWLTKPSEQHIEVNHKDGNKDNNSADNLEWVTRAENHDHAVRMELVWNLPKQGQCGFRRKDAQQKYN